MLNHNLHFSCLKLCNQGLDYWFFCQGLHGGGSLVHADHPLLVRPRLQHQRRQETGCPRWRQKCGAGAGDLRGNWATEINLPGLNTNTLFPGFFIPMCYSRNH